LDFRNSKQDKVCISSDHSIYHLLTYNQISILKEPHRPPPQPTPEDFKTVTLITQQQQQQQQQKTNTQVLAIR